jgi:stress response protein YsnF
VEKHPVVKEEVAVGKRAIQNTKQVGGKVRNTTLSVRFN